MCWLLNWALHAKWGVQAQYAALHAAAAARVTRGFAIPPSKISRALSYIAAN
jgi:hypothetical protein